MASTQPAHADLVRVIARRGVTDKRVLDAFGQVPREEFVPAEHRSWAYRDEPLPIPHGQVTTQPSLVASMVEALGLEGPERVLEIGTGYGFQTAILARLAEDVWSVEYYPELAEAARESLRRHGANNAHVVAGDGSIGLAEHAPYDAIIVSAAFPRVPAPLVDQLADGGPLVQPIGEGGHEDVVLFEKRAGRLEPVRSLVGARFVRLYGRHGFPK